MAADLTFVAVVTTGDDWYRGRSTCTTLEAVSGPFGIVNSHGIRSVARALTGIVICWGGFTAWQCNMVTDSLFTEIAVGTAITCGVTLEMLPSAGARTSASRCRRFLTSSS